jgi:hypothetical protein
MRIATWNVNSLKARHAPLVIDLERPGHSFEAGWAAAEARIAARRAKAG